MVFTDNDLVMYKQNGKMYSAGFTVNSLMMEHGISPITTGGGGGSKGSLLDSFNNLAIPAGLYHFDGGLEQEGGAKNATYITENKDLSDELYSTLLGLAEGEKEPQEESKKEHKKHKKTKRLVLKREHKRKTKRA